MQSEFPVGIFLGVGDVFRTIHFPPLVESGENNPSRYLVVEKSDSECTLRELPSPANPDGADSNVSVSLPEFGHYSKEEHRYNLPALIQCHGSLGSALEHIVDSERKKLKQSQSI